MSIQANPFIFPKLGIEIRGDQIWSWQPGVASKLIGPRYGTTVRYRIGFLRSSTTLTFPNGYKMESKGIPGLNGPFFNIGRVNDCHRFSHIVNRPVEYMPPPNKRLHAMPERY
jgi:hypothetical protein